MVTPYEDAMRRSTVPLNPVPPMLSPKWGLEDTDKECEAPTPIRALPGCPRGLQGDTHPVTPPIPLWKAAAWKTRLWPV